MSSTDWIQQLKVVELKEELKKRDQPVAGKKAELAARLEDYVKEHEAGTAKEPAVEAETAAEREDLAAKEAPTAAQEDRAPEKEAKAAGGPVPKAASAGEAEAAMAPAEAKAPAAADIDLDYGESDDEQPQKQERMPAEKPAEKPVAAATAAELSEKPENEDQEQERNKKEEPESRKRPTSDVPPAEETSRPEKQAKTEQQPSEPAEVDSKKIKNIIPFLLQAQAREKAKLEESAAEEAEAKRIALEKQQLSEQDIKKFDDVKPFQEAGADTPAVAAATEKAEKPEQQQELKSGSRALLIEGFVRPFTENQARTLLGQSGTVVAMWMPSIRNLAWVVYSTITEAEAAKTAFFKLQWPAGSPKVLMPRSVSIRAAEKAIGHGKGDENFKIDRTEEDGPDEPDIETTSKAMNTVGTMAIPAGNHFTSRQPQHATADDEELLKDASPLRVKDLRELLSRKSTGGAGTAERKARDPGPNLDELFRKTTAKPSIYWLPLSEEAVELRKKAMAATGGGGGSGAG